MPARSRFCPTFCFSNEPFVSLDAALALRRLSLIEACKTTTLIVAHDIEEAIALADRVVILSHTPARMVADKSIAAPRLAMKPELAATVKAEIEALISAAAGVG